MNGVTGLDDRHGFLGVAINNSHPACITQAEPVRGAFLVLSNDPVVVRCEYCERSIDAADFVWA